MKLSSLNAILVSGRGYASACGLHAHCGAFYPIFQQL